MSDEKRILPDAWRDQIEAHLDAIERIMMQTNVSRSSRLSIVEMVEGQIEEMCTSRLTPESTDEDFRAIMAELDAPECYAGDGTASLETTTEPAKPRVRFSKFAIVSVALPIAAAVFMGLGALTNSVLFIGLFWVFAVAALLSPALGWIALGKIDQSDGLLRGRNLALTGIYVPVLALLNGILALIGAVAPFVLLGLGAVLVVAAANWLVFKAVRSLIANYSFTQLSWNSEPNGSVNGAMPA
ncbi:MAG: hypothetical protein AAF497_02670 [Planctomycetota bacterium]